MKVKSWDCPDLGVQSDRERPACNRHRPRIGLELFVSTARQVDLRRLVGGLLQRSVTVMVRFAFAEGKKTKTRMRWEAV